MKINKTISRTLATYKREVEMKPVKNVTVSVMITLFVFLIFGIFGIRPAINNLAQKNKSIKDYEKLVTALTDKTNQLKDFQTSLGLVEPNLYKLKQAIPETENLQAYLEEIVLSASKEGYLIKNMRKTVRTDKESTISIKLTLQGGVENINKLIEQLENVNRLTLINRVTVLRDEKMGDTITVDLDVFYLKNSEES